MTFHRAATIPCAIALVLALGGRAHAARDPFHDAATLNARLHELHDANPGITRLVTVARTPRGDVLSLEVDPDGHFADDAPVLLLQGGVHGNEWISTEVVLRLAELVAGDRHPRWNGLTYRFIPAVNIGGFAAGTRKAFDVDGKPYDANRAFPVPEQEDYVSPPLVQALRDYALTGKVVAVLDYHSAAECLLWPWAYAADREPPDLAPLMAVTSEMAMSVGYCAGQVAKVIRYKHQGTAADWYQHVLRAPTLLIELAAVDDPGSQTVEQILIDQERPFAIFLDWLEDRGLKTRVPDADPAGCATAVISVGRPPLGYRATGSICDGLRHGPWTFAFQTGETMRTGTYDRGREEGPWATFHQGGAPQDVGAFVGGKPDGPWLRRDPAGTAIEERSFAGGWRDGLLLRWSSDGSLWQIRTCQAGFCVNKCKATKKKPCVRPGDEPPAKVKARIATPAKVKTRTKVKARTATPKAGARTATRRR